MRVGDRDARTGHPDPLVAADSFRTAAGRLDLVWVSASMYSQRPRDRCGTCGPCPGPSRADGGCVGLDGFDRTGIFDRTVQPWSRRPSTPRWQTPWGRPQQRRSDRWREASRGDESGGRVGRVGGLAIAVDIAVDRVGVDARVRGPGVRSGSAARSRTRAGRRRPPAWHPAPRRPRSDRPRSAPRGAAHRCPSRRSPRSACRSRAPRQGRHAAGPSGPPVPAGPSRWRRSRSSRRSRRGGRAGTSRDPGRPRAATRPPRP